MLVLIFSIFLIILCWQLINDWEKNQKGKQQSGEKSGSRTEII
jgi:membrane protein implicated in regulation of membrane protease activity